MMARSAQADLKILEQKLGYSFQNQALLIEALTHTSAMRPNKRENYQRLEFLGDRVLGLVIAEALFKLYPGASEGELSRRFSNLVCKDACVQVALDWGADAFLRLGAGEKLANEATRSSVMSDIAESIIGAVFMESGYEAARVLIESAWKKKLAAPGRPLRDAKTALQEWAQAQGLPTPTYEQISRTGPDHAPEFVIAVKVDGFAPMEAIGTTKRTGEQASAEAFLKREGIGRAMRVMNVKHAMGES